MAKVRMPAAALCALLLTGWALAPVSAGEPAAAPRWTILPDAAGRIARVVVQLSTAHFEAATPVVESLLPKLADTTQVEIVCGRRQDAKTLAARLAASGLARPERIAIHLEPMLATPWARDRFVAGDNGLGQSVLWLPRGLATPTGDERVPRLLAGCYGHLLPLPVELPVEGGDLVVGKHFVLVGPTSARRMRAADPRASEAALAAKAERVFGRRVLFVPRWESLPAEASPVDLHLDLLAGVLADDTVVVGDPAAGAALLTRLPAHAWLPPPVARDSVLAASDAEVAARADAIATALKAAGLRVERLPAVALCERACLVSYTNTLQEETSAGPVVYLPQYGCRPLDESAQRAYVAHGYRVETVDVRPLFQWQGALRCLANVVERRAK